MFPEEKKTPAEGSPIIKSLVQKVAFVYSDESSYFDSKMKLARQPAGSEQSQSIFCKSHVRVTYCFDDTFFQVSNAVVRISNRTADSMSRYCIDGKVPPFKVLV